MTTTDVPPVESAEADTARRRSLSLGDAFGEFIKHPSPWTLFVMMTGAIIARVIIGNWQAWDAILPAIMIAVFPVYEWLIHVFVLHRKPRKILGVKFDSILARDHRRHHADPRDVPLVFIPTPALYWIVPATIAIAVFAFPWLGLGITYLVVITAAGLGYEWTHFLVHTDYRPKTSIYRAVWTNHRLHHFKNEHYWFTVTSSGTADRLLHTYPDPTSVPKSPTARNLHALSDIG